MSNIDKQARDKLKSAAAKAADNFDPNMFVETRDVLGLLDELEAKDKRIAELEAKLETADKLQDSAFRHGLQHGFSLGQTDNQAGFEECLSAYGTRGRDNG
ncbi:ead/Ea22-like family protein [Enterobacter kobei]|uniref:ead/Ea22-like family protein n=1 Tax=Enterobacter kobei TaxID=208224 RepID=UPI0021756027|nr:ead/Ea22-like family protein [Enterobacter kobei]MCS4604198.1 ead/Ea22-like family protein [Enterobacter kobei]